MRIKSKKLALLIVVFFISCLLIFSCSSNPKNKSKHSSNSNSYSSSEFNGDEESKNDDGEILDCTFDDGIHSATVDYNNPKTGYSATYTLDVEVYNCQVIQIDFPNGGYLDEDHISATDIDEDGNATIEGENGKTYDVHINN